MIVINIISIIIIIIINSIIAAFVMIITFSFFRGNSIATKAMEVYVKLVGEKYLEDTLRSTLLDILTSDLDLEVDPIKVSLLGSIIFVILKIPKNLPTDQRQTDRLLGKLHFQYLTQLSISQESMSLPPLSPIDIITSNFSSKYCSCVPFVF